MLVLFDLDGTILDSLDAWAASYRKAVFPKVITDEEIVRDFLQPTQESLSRHGIRNRGEYFRSLNVIFKENSGLVKLEADVESALDQLERKGHILGIITSRPKEIAKTHCPPHLLSKFKVFIDREDAFPKPHPDGIFKACRETGTPLNKTVFVGSHPVDAACAKNAGVQFLLYKPNGQSPFRNYPRLVGRRQFSSFRELPDLIRSMTTEKKGR
jgi:pyrophosphatase PpaX